MKYLLMTAILMLLPIVNAHRLLGSLVSNSGDHIPIENHLSDKALRILETAVDDSASKHCQNSKCEKGLLGYFNHLFSFILDRFE
jgi:hypothetical protein